MASVSERSPVTTKNIIRVFSEANKRSFVTTLSLINWNLIEFFDNVDLAMTAFQNVLWFIFDSFFPRKTVRFRNTDPPWMSPSLKVLMDHRDRAYNDKKTDKYLRLRQAVIHLTCSLKNNYLRKVENASNSREAWKRIRMITRNPKSMALCPSLSAAALSDFFSSVFQNSAMNSFSYDSTALPDHTLRVSGFQVEKRLRHLKKGNGGPDGVPFWIYKDNSFLLASSVAHIFNLCFRVGRVPSLLKFANVIPLPKCSKPTQASDFRPISLLPVLSKVLEKIVLSEWIVPYVSSQLDPMQFAYVPGAGRGTVGALTLINHFVLKHLDGKSGAVRVLTADYTKAFDRLTFESILSAIVKFKLPKLAIVFLKDFLCCRQQRVTTTNDASDWTLIKSGVPQGSVLGPMLFALVIDSLRPLSNNTFIIKYADDVTFVHHFRDTVDDHLQDEWSHLETWSHNVGLRLNYEKCHVMDCVTKSSLCLAPIVSDDGVILQSVTSIRLLGVIFSSNLSWNEHVSYVISKCYKRFFILRNLKRVYCSHSVIYKCYISFIRSLLLYGYPSFCNLPKYLFLKLTRVERLACRYFSSVRFCPLSSAADTICRRLFCLVANHPDHPLRLMFDERSPTPRNPSTVKPPRALTKRFMNSFIKYGR